MRKAISRLKRYIGTPYTAKHRPFVFIPSEFIPDAMVYVVASEDAAVLGVLSSVVHTAWSRFSGGTLEDRPRYNSRATFFPFPFPDQSGERLDRIAELAETIDDLRKRQQAAHPTLSLTDVYNVLEAVREGRALDAGERRIYDQACVGLLLDYHDTLDREVLAAYEWSDLLPLLQQARGRATRDLASEAWGLFEAELIQRLIQLNGSRASDEKRGLVRHLRARHAEDRTAEVVQEEIETGADVLAETPGIAAVATAWPREAVDQLRAITETLAESPSPMSIEEITARFKSKGPWKKRVPHVLDMLVAVGRAQERDGRYALH
jgi:hypothetical protein